MPTMNSRRATQSPVHLPLSPPHATASKLVHAISDGIAASRRCCVGEVSLGSWPCDNAEAGSLTGPDCSATKLGEVCEHIFPISSLTQPDAVPRIVSLEARPEPRKPSSA